MSRARAAVLLVLLPAFLAAVPAGAADPALQIEVSAGGNLANTIPYGSSSALLFDDLGLLLSYRSDNLFFFMDGGLRNDGVYSPEASYTVGHSIDLKNAFVELAVPRFSLSAGRRTHSDVVESPYALFISSSPIPALVADARYEDDRFFYETRWVQLNYRSTLYLDDDGNPLDRGMNYKVYGFKLGNVRFGIQDSIVYVGRAFDAGYFLSPMFQYLQQEVRSTAGKPWTEDNNCNSINGFFVDVRTPRAYAYAQVLVDDINLDFLGFWGRLKMPNKLAWSLGGRMDFPFGTLGFYTAGATKYTFEATYTDATHYSLFPYEYTYYPASEYDLADGTPMTIDYTRNYIGYEYGENALSFRVDYRTDFAPCPVTLSAAVEYVINGSKSPSNPWHELDSWTELDYLYHSHTYLLEDPQLEHTVLGTVAAAVRFGRLEASARVKLGGRWNSLRLTEVVAGEPKVYLPVGPDSLLYEVRLGVAWRFFR